MHGNWKPDWMMAGDRTSSYILQTVKMNNPKGNCFYLYIEHNIDHLGDGKGDLIEDFAAKVDLN